MIILYDFSMAVDQNISEKEAQVYFKFIRLMIFMLL